MSRNQKLMGRLLSLLLCLLLTSGAMAQEKLNIGLRDATMAQLAKEIQRQVDYTFVYADEVVKDVRISVSMKDATLTHVLTEALRGTGLTFRVTNRHIVIGRLKASTTESEPTKKTRTISGHIVDAVSRETLIGATAYCSETRQGAASNEYGFFSLTLPCGSATLRFSYIGYETQTVALDEGGDVALSIRLMSDNQIEEVEVKADRPETGNASTRTGAVTVPVAFISQVPSLMSEPDVMRALQTLPGVQKGMSGTSGIFVRGGGQEQNLYLLDGVSLYNVDHLFGFMSAFMPDAVKNVDFYKSAFPARYGGRLSSVVDVRTKDGDMQSYHGSFSVGLLSSHASFEGPIKPEKTSFCVSARRSYADAIFGLISLMSDDYDINALRPSFYDVNAKLNHILSENDRLFASFYLGKDSYRYDLEEPIEFYIYNDKGLLVIDPDHIGMDKLNMTARWGNVLGTLRWNHIYSPRLFANTTLAFNKFGFDLKQSNSEETWVKKQLTSHDEYSSRYESGISDLTFIHDLDFHPTPQHHVRMGGQYVLHRFLPEVTRGTTNTMIEGDKDESRSTFDSDGEKSTGHDVCLYAEDDMDLTDRFQMIMGLRASLFGVEGKVYPALEPRLSACFRPADLWRLKASYAMMHQYVHLLSTMPISLPTDLWVPVSKDIKPMSSNQVSLGVYSDAVPTFSLSVEAYYKWMDNVLDFKDGANFSGNTSTGWQRLVASGRGKSRGLELSAQRTEGRVTGQVSYTLSKTEHKYGPDLNAGRWFPFRYDRRHVLNIVAQCKLNDKVDFGAQWSYATGACMSVPDKLIRLELPSPNDGQYVNAENSMVCSARNNYRLKPTHSLDLNVNFHRQLRHVSRTLSVSLMNAYARHNQDIVYAEQEGYMAREDGSLRPSDGEMLETDVRAQRTLLRQTTLIPFLPSISYTIKF